MFEDNQLICFIVLVIVLLAILFTVIAIYLKRESDEILSSGQLTSNLFSPPEDLIGTESMSGGELKRVNKKVQILTQKDFINLRLSDFWILDKYDGINREYKDDNYEFIYEEVVPLKSTDDFQINSLGNLKLNETESLERSETEGIQGGSRQKNRKIIKGGSPDSSETVKFVFDILKSEGKDLRTKPFEERMKANLPKGFYKKAFGKVEDKDFLLERLWGNKTDTVEQNGLIIPIDGLILQNDFEAFKLKKTYLNTIDFRMRYENGRIYLSTLNRDGTSFDRFYNPFFDNNVCYLNEKPILNDDISERIKSEIFNGYSFIVSNAAAVSEKFGEFTNISGKWYFLRMRDHPNSSMNAIKIASLIYNPIHTSEGYFNRVQNSELVQSFHHMSHAIRRKLFDIIHKESPEAHRLLDIACGRGGDIKEAERIGIYSFVAIDSDKDAVTDYALKAPYRSLVSNNIITKTTLLKMKDLLQKRVKFGLCDICLINFAIHYLSDCLSELGTFIRELMVPGGKIFITFFDSDAILRSAKDGKIEIDGLKISVLDNGQLRMPLPTIARDGSRVEPMINQEQLKTIGKNPKIISLEIKSSEAKGFEKIAKYTKFIKLAIF